MSKTIGYTEGVFDLFHEGHLNHLKKAKKRCDFLVVGVFSDKIVQGYKKRKPIIPQRKRMSILSNIKFVDKVIAANVRDDKSAALKKIKFNILFTGSDWKNTERFKEIEQILSKKKVKIVYLPYTEKISTTLILKKIKGRSRSFPGISKRISFSIPTIKVVNLLPYFNS